MKVDLEFLADAEIYRRVMKEEVPAACRSLLVASALVKQTKLEAARGIIPFCELMNDLLARKVRVTLLFSGSPSRPFMETLRSFPDVLAGASLRICPRNHMKAVLVDGARLYLGSANLTGAGLGMKGADRRNFEVGFLTEDPKIIARFAELVDAILCGRRCGSCGTRKLCRREHEKFAAGLAGG